MAWPVHLHMQAGTKKQISPSWTRMCLRAVSTDLFFKDVPIGQIKMFLADLIGLENVVFGQRERICLVKKKKKGCNIV